MFKIGDTVRNVSANIVGVVVDVDGETIYLEQDNGAEVDFDASSLVLEDAFQAKHDKSSLAGADAQANDPVIDAVIDNLYPAVIEIGQRAHSLVKPVPGVAPRSWDELSSLQKLNVISEATDVPVKNWMDANHPGAKPSLATLQLSVLGSSGA